MTADMSFRRHRRYQSLAAQQFSTTLDSLFRIDDGIDSLVSNVEDKRRSLLVQERELDELQQRIREAEERLKLSSLAATAPSVVTAPTSNVEEPFSLPSWISSWASSSTSRANKRHTMSLFSVMSAPIPEEPSIIEEDAPVVASTPARAEIIVPVATMPAPAPTYDSFAQYSMVSRPRRRRRARLEDHYFYEEEEDTEAATLEQIDETKRYSNGTDTTEGTVDSFP